MPNYTIQAPDGRKITIEAGDEQTALRGAQEWAKANPPKPKAAKDAEVVANALRGQFPGGVKLPAPLQRFNEDVFSRARGATGGWLDEGAAKIYGVSVDATNALADMIGKKGLGYTGKEGAKAVRNALTEVTAEQRRERPISSVVNEVAGGMWMPGAKYIGGAKTLGQAALRSAQVGAVAGGVTGAGNAETGERLRKGIEGAGIGAVVGGAVPYAARGAQELAKRSGAAASEVADRVRLGLGRDLPEPSPSQMKKAAENATDYVSGIVRANPRANLSANPIEASGKPIMAAEAIGRPGVTQLSAIGRRSGATGDMLESNLRQRAQAMPERVQADLEVITGLSGDAIRGDFAAQATALRTKATPLYEAAYAKPAVQNAELETLLKRPSMKSAMNRAVSIAREEGRDPTTLGFDFDAAGDVIHIRTPSNQTLDYVKRGLDDVLESYRDGTTGKLRLDERGRAVLGTLNRYREIIAPEGSAYRAALDAGGEPIRLEQAFNNSKRMMTNATRFADFRQKFSGYSDAEREAHVAGFVSDAFDRVQAGKLRLKDMQSPAYVRKVRLMLGEDRATDFLARLEQEAALARTGGRMMPGGGSPTMELQAADADITEGAKALRGATRKFAEGKYISGAMEALSSPLVGAYRGAQAPIDRATRDEVGRLLQLLPSELDAVLKAAAAAKTVRKPLPRPAVNALVPSLSAANANQKSQ